MDSEISFVKGFSEPIVSSSAKSDLAELIDDSGGQPNIWHFLASDVRKWAATGDASLVAAVEKELDGVKDDEYVTIELL